VSALSWKYRQAKKPEMSRVWHNIAYGQIEPTYTGEVPHNADCQRTWSDPSILTVFIGSAGY
jgi:hypothetical protein